MSADVDDPLAPPAADAGLRCPRCDYNLTGLPQPRCPECGVTFDWNDPRLSTHAAPQIAFERARGWRKIPGFLETWATVLFAPWVFARQAVVRISAWHALVFGAVCFASTFGAMFAGADLDFMATWLVTAAIYLPLQAAGLSILEAPGWRKLLRSLGFWLCVGGYTCAVMPTEVVIGPPPLGVSHLRSLCEGRLELHVPGDWPKVVVVGFQLALWLWGLACLYLARVRPRRSAAVAWLLTLLAVPVLLVLYCVAYELIGADIVAHWFINWP